MNGYIDKPYIDGAGTTWAIIRCGGCGVPCGYSSGDTLRRSMYCSPWCVWEYEVRQADARSRPPSPQEARKDIWYWLYQSGRRISYIATLFGIDNDFRVHKAIRPRQEDDATKTRRPSVSVRKGVRPEGEDQP